MLDLSKGTIDFLFSILIIGYIIKACIVWFTLKYVQLMIKVYKNLSHFPNNFDYKTAKRYEKLKSVAGDKWWMPNDDYVINSENNRNVEEMIKKFKEENNGGKKR